MAVTFDQVRRMLRAFEPDYASLRKLGPEVLPHLNTLVKDPKPTIASRAAYLAGLIGDDRSEGVLRAAAASPSPVVRAAAADAIRKFARPAGSGLLINLLHDSDAGVRKVAVRAAADSSNAALVSKVANISRTDPKPWVRNLAARVIKSRGIA